MAENGWWPTEWADGIREELNYIGICQLSHTLTDSKPAGMCALPSVPCLEKIMQLMENQYHGGFACTFDTCEEPARMFFDIQNILREMDPVHVVPFRKGGKPPFTALPMHFLDTSYVHLFLPGRCSRPGYLTGRKIGMRV